MSTPFHSLPQWEVDLIGEERDLAHLVRHFSTEAWHIFADERSRQTLMRVDGFASDASPELVLSKAEMTVNELSGVLKTMHQSHQPLKVGGVMKRLENGRRIVFVSCLETIRANVEIDAEVWRRDAHGHPVLQPSGPPGTLTLAMLTRANPEVAKAMRLSVALDAGTWAGLYRLFEVIEQAEPNIVKKGWTSKTQRERFKRSANSTHVAGDAARHGSDKFDPPLNPMELREADAYVHMLLHAWLAQNLAA